MDIISLAVFGRLAVEQIPSERTVVKDAIAKITADGAAAPVFSIAPDPLRAIGTLPAPFQVALVRNDRNAPRIFLTRCLGFVAMVFSARRALTDLLVAQIHSTAHGIVQPDPASDILRMLGDAPPLPRSVTLTVRDLRKPAIGR